MIPQPDFSTCDLCDAHKASDAAALRVMPGSRWRSYGYTARFCGPIATVRCFEDNSRIKEAVESPGDARVLVVDGGASLRRSLLGGKLAAAAEANGWAGLLIHGAVRDLAELRQTHVGILALGHVPMPTDRQGQGLFNVALLLDGTPIRPGEWLYADEDGVLIAPGPLC
ncbi:MAG: ribonuclease E activity regulator RraA [Inhella sp.]|jgi:regulator of ribonuclease activity A